MKNASKRNVDILMIVQKYSKSNIEVIQNFKKNGYKIKHYPDKGFHLVIADCKRSIVGINNPQNTDERIGIQLSSRGISKAFRHYFYSIWKKAKVV